VALTEQAAAWQRVLLQAGCRTCFANIAAHSSAKSAAHRLRRGAQLASGPQEQRGAGHQLLIVARASAFSGGLARIWAMDETDRAIPL